MNDHNTEKKPTEADKTLFSCEFSNLRKRSSDNVREEICDFASFESWIDGQLEALEARFAHNMTMDSLRADLKKSR